MATLNEIAYDIRDLARSTHGSTTDKLSIDQIKFWIHSYRSLFIRRDEDRNGFNPTSFEHTIFVPLEPVPVQDYPVVFIGRNELVRSCAAIPMPVRTKGRSIGYIGSADYENPIPYVHSSRLAYTNHSKFGSLIPSAYIINEKLYITKRLNGVVMNIIAENPEELKNFKDQYGESITDDSAYPVPADYIARIRETILKTEIRQLLGAPEDNLQDNIQDK
jgi:hypothetical protein